ncbi:MAG: Crp/Fnr family transcriptional regulator [Chitinophagales bacterium]|nr:Crp/Fnr family transcriptional regulator [Chitinophagales bacterium]MDW8417863.1 Crp/Fnr family transcriptional regulator [Chitinophagales bacterium]
MIEEAHISKLQTILEPELVKELFQYGDLIHFHAGDVIMDYGKYVRSMPIILKGTVKVMRQDENGKEILLYYLSDSESCSMAYGCCMTAKKSEVKAVAEEDGTLIAVPYVKLNDWLCQYTSWRNYIFNSFNDRFLELLHSVDIMAFGNMDKRIREYLRSKSERTGSTVIKVSHHKIADELATTRVVVSRILKQFENNGLLLLYRNEIKLLKPFFENE